MVESKDVAERVVYYFRSTYGLGETIKIDSNMPEKVDYKDFSFVIDLKKGSGIEDKLDVTIIPPRGSERDFEHYLASLKNSQYYREVLPENLRARIKKHKRRMRGAGFVSDPEQGYHHVSGFLPTSDSGGYLEKLSLAVIDCVVRPALSFGRNRTDK
ncbi:MAG: hypothetical protein AABW51_04010 [Nanoarchaeota archaeon]